MSSSNVKVTVVTRSRSRQQDTEDHRPPSEDPGSRTEHQLVRQESLEESFEHGQADLLSLSSEGDESSIEISCGEADKMAEARGPLITPGRFHGGPEENVEDYLAQFERVARANGWEQNKKLVILPCYLDGAALRWYENAEGRLGERMTWDLVKNGLKEAFQSVAYDEQLEYRLRMRMQGETETVESYMQDVLNLCSKVDGDMSERSRIKHVLRGLRPSLLEKVMVMENGTLEALTNNIKRVQTARFMAGQRVDHLMAEPSRGRNLAECPREEARPSPVASTLEKKIEDLTSEFSKFSMRLMEQWPKTSGLQPTTSEARRGSEGAERGFRNERGGRGFRSDRGSFERGRGNYRGNSRGRTQDGRVICFRCNRPGHFAVACKSAPSGNANEER